MKTTEEFIVNERAIHSARLNALYRQLSTLEAEVEQTKKEIDCQQGALVAFGKVLEHTREQAKQAAKTAKEESGEETNIEQSTTE